MANNAALGGASFLGGMFKRWLADRDQNRQFAQQQQLVQQTGDIQSRRDAEHWAALQSVAETKAEAVKNKPAKWVPTTLGETILLEEAKAAARARASGGKGTDPWLLRGRVVNLLQDMNPDADPEELSSAIDAALGGGMEGYQSYMSEHGPLKKKQPSRKDKNTEIKGLIDGWQQARINADVRARKAEDPYASGTEQAGFVEPPTYGGQPMSAAKDKELASFMVDNPDMDQQEAANYLYAQEVADRLSAQYGVDDTEPAFNIQKLQQAAQAIGKPLELLGIGGNTSIAELAALTATGEWTEAELKKLLQQYSAPANPVQKAYQGALNVR